MSERIDDLQYKGLKLIQDSEGYRFGCDAVELANFVSGKAGQRAYDLGCGNGIIALLLAAKRGMRVTAVEVQAGPAELARRNVKLNALEALIEVVEAPMQRLCAFTPAGCADLVVSNPPYRRRESGKRQLKAEIAAARHEILVSLKEVIDTAAFLLTAKGRFYFVLPSERLAEAVFYCTSARLEPKQLQLLRPAAGKSPHIFLMLCVKGGRPGLAVMPERDVRIYGLGD